MAEEQHLSTFLLLAILSSYSVYSTYALTNGAVILYRNGYTSSSYYYGIVRVYYNGWGNICDDYYYSSTEANVICHQLGYTGTSSYSRAGLVSYGTDTLSMKMDDLNCYSSNYLTIFQCSFSTYIDSGCTNTNSYDATVYCYTTRIWNTSPFFGMIRLQGGSYPNEGRVEVYCNGQWGTICDNGFGSTDARTICKQLGYNNYYNYDHLSLSGNSSQPIWSTYMSSSSSDTCYGNSNSCPSTSMISCSHYEDVTVECTYSTSYSKSSNTKTTCSGLISTPRNGAIILYRNGYTSSSYYYGIVRVYYNNGWGNICYDYYYSSTEANVICHQLGYAGASSYSRAGLVSYGTDTFSLKMSELNCTSSNYLTIFQCSFSTIIDSGCNNTNSYDATVYCYTTKIWNSNPFSGMIRLQGGSYPNEGLVEVYCNGQWGTICDDGFSSFDAQTLCKQLGYNNYYSYDHLSLSGNSSQPIWSTYMSSSSSDTCYGTSNSCPMASVTSCFHTEDVTIACTYNTSISKLSNTKTTCLGLISDVAQNGAIILYRNEYTSSSYYYGIVRVYYNGWGNICDDDYFNQYEADVICHQLGYTGASSYSKAGLVSYGTDILSMKMDDLNCPSSNYLTIFQCSFSTYIDSGCTNTNSYDATVYCYTTKIWNSNPFFGMIRLQGGSYPNQGRVEVYCNEQWGTICDDGFSSTDAQTICKQLGYNSYYSYDHLNYLYGTSSQPIWSTYMYSISSDTCFGNRNSCPSTSITSCNHNEDITVTCIYDSSYSKSSNSNTTCSGLISKDAQNGAIILSRNGYTSSTYYYGIVRVYYNNGWGNICDDYYYSSFEANVICHQLGYTGASSYSRAGLVSYGTDTLSMKIDDINCANSNYLTIFQCSFSTYIDSGCTNTDSYDATVYCYTTRIWNSNPFSGMIRLQGGNYSNEGRVEVYCNGQWGTICDDGFSSTDAQTICKQLGYNSYYNYDHLVLPANSSQPIWSTYMSSSSSDTCYGTRNSCSSTSITSCNHYEDITVTCVYSSLYSRSSNSKTTCSRLISDDAQNGAIILFRSGYTSSSYYYGIVRVYYNNGWGNICDDYYYSSTEANVICHQLGYTGASSYSRAGLVSYGTDTLSMKMDDLDCASSNYLTIFQCSFSTYIDSGCTNTNSYDATVYCYTIRIWNSNLFSGMIRLQGGNYSNEGRVEVYCNGKWGTICDDGFGSTDAQAICKQLGYNYYHRYDHLSLSGTSGQPIWSTYMSSSSSDRCYGNSNSCPLASVTSCTHYEDITVTCIYSSSYSKPSNSRTTCSGLISSSSNIGFGTLRLYRNGYTLSSYYYGIVQIYINGQWGNICDDIYYSQYEADVICHQLGYTGASSYSRAGLVSYGTDYSPMVLDDVNCPNNNYLTILQCLYSTIIDSACTNTNSYDGTVSCYSTRIWNSNLFSGMIRLQGGDYSNEGRVEVYCNGQWGTICDDGFDSNDALVICKQLGYSNYTSYNHLSLSGSSFQHIWMSNLACSSSFSCLGSCQSCPTNSYQGCSHSEDITIQCSNPKSLSSVSTLRATCRGVTPAPPTTASSNVTGLFGGMLSSILLTIIVTSICCIIVVVLIIKVNRQNVRRYNAQQVELQTIPSPETTIVQPRRYQGSNVCNLEAHSYVQTNFCNPAHGVLSAAHGRSHYNNVQGPTEEVGTLMDTGPPRYSDLFN